MPGLGELQRPQRGGTDRLGALRHIHSLVLPFVHSFNRSSISISIFASLFSPSLVGLEHGRASGSSEFGFGLGGTSALQHKVLYIVGGGADLGSVRVESDARHYNTHVLYLV